MVVNSGLCEESMPSLRKILPTSYTRSSPPTMSRFKYSSVSMRRYMSMSSALWWVLKGRASAPISSVKRTGVSTSVYPLPSR